MSMRSAAHWSIPTPEGRPQARPGPSPPEAPSSPGGPGALASQAPRRGRSCLGPCTGLPWQAWCPLQQVCSRLQRRQACQQGSCLPTSQPGFGAPTQMRRTPSWTKTRRCMPRPCRPRCSALGRREQRAAEEDLPAREPTTTPCRTSSWTSARAFTSRRSRLTCCGTRRMKLRAMRVQTVSNPSRRTPCRTSSWMSDQVCTPRLHRLPCSSALGRHHQRVAILGMAEEVATPTCSP
mmetsp:Transcript_100234/g.223875  ORF Transcript_100234/g.223875 Transcript_100234/m.223875 type:complete len:236 (+) Transcript_100234:1362-2069(+)